MIDTAAIEALLSASPLVIAVVCFMAGWKACQHYAVKPTEERHRATITTLENRISALEQREASVMSGLMKKAGL